jgi:P-type conjugative transfer protein TrbG
MKARFLLGVVFSAAIAFPASADRQGRHARSVAASQTPIEAVANANASARHGPTQSAFQQARQVYAYQPGAIYELFANPNYISSILLEPGETLSTIAAGDTSRWMVTEAEGETDSDGRTIVLVKPQAANLRTNIVLITDRRTYLVEAVSQPGGVYSAQVAWTYPQSPGQTSAPTIANLNFNYRLRTVRGRTPIWSPARVFDDGLRTWVEFAPDVAASDMPPLFVITADGGELVNYRVQGQRYLVDRVFDVAELRLGTNAQTIVRIERNPTIDAHRAPIRHGSHP